MTDKAQTSSKRIEPPTLGLAVVADLWLWGALLLYAPSYLGIGSGWEMLFYIPGFLLLIISFAGALIELGKLWKSQGLSYWGVSLVFLIPAIALHAAVAYGSLTGTFGAIAKIAALILFAIGGAMVFQGIPYLFWKEKNETASQSIASGAEDSKSTASRTTFEIMANIIVALLALATAIVTLAQKLFR